MKIVISIIAVFLLPVLCLSECSREQAFDKMMKLNQLSASLSAKVPLDPRVDKQAMNTAYSRMKEYADLMSPTGQLLADQRYSEACGIYDKVATRFGFKFEDTNALTMQALESGAKSKQNSGCDLTEMAQRSVKLATDFQIAYGQGKFTYEQQRQFSKDSEKLNMLATSDPAAACKEIDVLRSKYKL